MSLGGYLYKGYSVEKQSGWTEGQWALALHKCRVKAFLDSVARSGAAWVISRTGGSIDLDSTHTGCIYPLSTNSGDTQNGLYRGYATYFKYQEGSEPTGYYLILTAPRWKINTTPGDSSEAHDGIDLYVDNVYAYQYFYSSNWQQRFGIVNATCLHALSLSDFGTHPKENGYIPNDSTRISPIGAQIIANKMILNYSTSTSSGYTAETYIAKSSVSFGYSTKSGSPDIECFVKSDNTALANWHITVLSPLAISQTISTDDPYKLAMIGIYRSYFSADNMGETLDPSGSFRDIFYQFLRSDGTLPCGVFSQKEDLNTDLVYSGVPDGQTTSQRVYSSLACYTTRPNNTDIYTKGYLNIELIAFSYQRGNMYESVSSGKYLVVNYKSGVNSCRLVESSSSSSIYFYIGWDASNPSLSSTDACPVYTPVIE